jgi:hypothetical protein
MPPSTDTVRRLEWLDAGGDRDPVDPFNPHYFVASHHRQ